MPNFVLELDAVMTGAALALSTSLRAADKTGDAQIEQAMSGMDVPASKKREAKDNAKWRADQTAKAIQTFVDARIEELSD